MKTTYGLPLTQRTRLSLTLVGALVAVLAMSGCGFVQKQTSNAWSVSYEVTVVGEELNRLDAVSYLEAPSRGEDSETVDAGTVATSNLADDASKAVWSTTAMVTATQDSQVTATPGPGTTASCRILLDGTREIASETAARGEAVTCTAATPEFPARD